MADQKTPISYLFGPVYSSRLGYSLGIDLIPHKICNYDCVYCECGRTTTRFNQRVPFVNIERLTQELETYLSTKSEKIFDVVTVTGSGEPTLELHLKEVLLKIRELTPKPIAVLTNGSLISEPEVQQALALADIVLPSLDAATPDVFQKIDHPLPWLGIDSIVLGMIEFREKHPNVKFWLEILFIEGVNDGETHLQCLKKTIDLIRPHHVHIVTATRPVAYPEAQPVSQEKLREIRQYLWPYPEPHLPSHSVPRLKPILPTEFITEILEILKRRPLSVEELEKITGLSQKDLMAKLAPYVEQGKIRTTLHNSRLFYTR